MTVTCQTEGCGNAGVPIEISPWTDDEGTEHYPDVVVCGVCGQTITDIQQNEEES